MPNRTRRTMKDVPERRVSNRLPIERDLRYKVLGSRKHVKQVGSGKTLNMSSGGVLFTNGCGLSQGASAGRSGSLRAYAHQAIPPPLVACAGIAPAGDGGSGPLL